MLPEIRIFTKNPNPVEKRLRQSAGMLVWKNHIGGKIRKLGNPNATIKKFEAKIAISLFPKSRIRLILLKKVASAEVKAQKIAGLLLQEHKKSPEMAVREAWEFAKEMRSMPYKISCNDENSCLIPN